MNTLQSLRSFVFDQQGFLRFRIAVCSRNVVFFHVVEVSVYFKVVLLRQRFDLLVHFFVYVQEDQLAVFLLEHLHDILQRLRGREYRE